MPLTKPECQQCDYNLRGIARGEMCPECGGTERKLRFDGSSRLLSFCGVVMLALIAGSIAVMAARIAHIRLFPGVQGSWLQETTRSLRLILRPGLLGASMVGILLSYTIFAVDSYHHSVRRIRVIQIAICLLLSICAILLAVTWDT